MNSYIEPLLGMKNRVVELDGDKFWLTIPPIGLLYSLPKAYFDPDKALEMQFPEIAFSLFGTKNLDINTMPSHDTDIVCRLDMERQKQLMGRANTDAYSYRPMLVPLNSALQPDPNFEKENEPGALFYGGFLVSEADAPFSSVAHGGEKPYPSLHHITDSYYDVTLLSEDPGEGMPWFDVREPLAWVHIRGCLVCTKPVAVIDFPIMYSCKLVPTV